MAILETRQRPELLASITRQALLALTLQSARYARRKDGL
jgi:hypothetical protein